MMCVIARQYSLTSLSLLLPFLSSEPKTPLDPCDRVRFILGGEETDNPCDACTHSIFTELEELHYDEHDQKCVVCVCGRGERRGCVWKGREEGCVCGRGGRRGVCVEGEGGEVCVCGRGGRCKKYLTDIFTEWVGEGVKGAWRSLYFMSAWRSLYFMSGM